MKREGFNALLVTDLELRILSEALSYIDPQVIGDADIVNFSNAVGVNPNKLSFLLDELWHRLEDAK